MRIRKTAGIALVTALVVVGGARSGVAELKVGDQAPAFRLVGSDGKAYSLDQYRGERAVVLAWFPKAFTGG